MMMVALIWIGSNMLLRVLFPPPPPAQAEKDKDKEKGKGAGDKAGEAADPAKTQPVQPATKVEKIQRVQLGSADPNSPYRMLVTLTNRGAAIEHLELNSPRYRDIDEHSGHLGYLNPADATSADDAKTPLGARVQLVGPGTPAAKAELKPGDVITALDETKITRAGELLVALTKYKPGQQVKLTVLRQGAGEPATLTATLERRPLELIHPERDQTAIETFEPGQHDPFSLGLTLQQLGDKKLDDNEEELDGIKLLNSNWQVVSDGGPNADGNPEAAFEYALPSGVTITKRYVLAKVPQANQNDEIFKAYHLTFSVELKLAKDAATQQVAYRLNGPNGLPLEGYWYAAKQGIRDVVMQYERESRWVTPNEIVTDAKATKERFLDQKLCYLGVDAQYFAAALVCEDDELFDIGNAWTWLAGSKPKESNRNRLANASFRLASPVVKLQPGEPAVVHKLTFFAGPKMPDLLVQYGPAKVRDRYNLNQFVSYGWSIFGVVSRIMLAILHAIHAIIPSYGIAIILLTLIVRACMFPFSRKQAIGTQKMQTVIQPEMKKIKEKYKDDKQAQSRAMHELFRKHKYNPLGGCFLMLMQLPIFVGLYNALRVDVELRQAPLFSEAIRWCSNLAAPDMLFRWDSWLPFFSRDLGMFSLGPYFNFFPCVVIVLFIVQQKMFMPPAADEQAAMQQSMMKYSMILMGFMFYCVPCGLCLYFIVSSSWGILEKKLLPKTLPPVADAVLPANDRRPKKKRR